MAPSVLTDGPILFDASIYSEVCLRKGIEAYKEFLQIDFLSSNPAAQLVRLTPLSGSDPNALNLRRQFLNYVLDLSVQQTMNPQ